MGAFAVINMRVYSRRPRVAGLGLYPAPGFTVGSEAVAAQIAASLPNANVGPLNQALYAQPANLHPGLLVQPNPLGTQSPVGGGETEVAYFVLRNEAEGVGDPTRGQENYEHFVGPPYEAHRDDGTIEYIDPNAAVPANGERSWLRTWGPPIAVVTIVAGAFWILRRPRRR